MSAAASAASRARRGPRSGGDFEMAKASANSAETFARRARQSASKMQAVPRSRTTYENTKAAAPLSRPAFIRLTHCGLGGGEAAAMEAWCYRPHRLEAALLAMDLLIQAGCASAAYAIGLYAENAEAGRPARDVLFVEYDTYNNAFPERMADLEKKLNP